MRIRFFGSFNCQDCLKALVILSKYDISIDYVDAFDEETQELCDEEDVGELPHIQFIKNNKVIFEYIGPISEKKIEKILLTIGTK